MAQFTSPPTPINRISPLVAAEFLGAAPAVAGALPSAAAADHLHPLSPVPRKVVGFGLAQTLGAASGANATAYLYCRPVDLPAGASKWTIEGWLVWPSTTQSFGLFDGATGELYPGSPVIAFVAGGGLGPLNINAFFGGSNIATIAGAPITGHFAITCDGSATRYFINGSLLLTQPAAAFPAAAYFGAFVSSNGQGGNSLTADEWRVSTVARYTAAFSPPTAPFTPDSDTWALWHMDDTALGYWFAVWGGNAGAPTSPIAAWVQNTANDGVTPTIFEDVSYDSGGNGHELWAAAVVSGGLGISPPHFTTIEGVASPFGPESSAGTSLLVSSLQGQTGDLELMTPGGASAVSLITPGGGTGPTQLILALAGGGPGDPWSWIVSPVV